MEEDAHEDEAAADEAAEPIVGDAPSRGDGSIESPGLKDPSKTQHPKVDETKAEETKAGEATKPTNGPTQLHVPSRVASQVSVLSSVPSIGSMSPLPFSTSLWASDLASLSVVDTSPSAAVPMQTDSAGGGSGSDSEDETKTKDDPKVRCHCTFVRICKPFAFLHICRKCLN